MRYFKVSMGDARWLGSQPESGMGFQIVTFGKPEAQSRIFVVGGLVALDFDDSAAENDRSDQPWFLQSAYSERLIAFEAWRDGLSPLSKIGPNRQVVRLSGNPPPPPPPPVGGIVGPPAPPPQIYGHLPFVNTVVGNEVFYRWEAWPVSQRVNQKTGAIAKGTFTSPQSEVPFVPTGFAAVGRFALPFLPPASFRWELKPPAATVFRCGASVPLYGQAGGGVEAEFSQGFNNVGPVANPVVLPAM